MIPHLLSLAKLIFTLPLDHNYTIPVTSCFEPDLDPA
jgi:hypothetical protein